MIVFAYLVVILYLLMMLVFFIGVIKNKEYKPKKDLFTTSFTIIIPVKNDIENLIKLLQSINEINYNFLLLEVIVVDDFSDEEIYLPNYNFNVQVIKNIRTSSSPKKDAIENAIQLAKNNWIITTDADVIVPKNWLAILNDFILENVPQMVAMGVKYNTNNSFLHQFQHTEFLTLQAVTVGSFGCNLPFMCNGANFAYTKDFYRALNGFNKNNHIASGDDVFLLQKAVKTSPEKVLFLNNNETIVSTKTENSFKSLFYQRVRWASKSASYILSYAKTISIITFMANFSVIFLLIFSFFYKPYIQHFILLISIKIAIDYALLISIKTTYKTNTKYYLISAILYPFFSCIVAIYAMIYKKYVWKGKVYSK